MANKIDFDNVGKYHSNRIDDSEFQDLEKNLKSSLSNTNDSESSNQISAAEQQLVDDVLEQIILSKTMEAMKEQHAKAEEMYKDE